MLFPSRWLYEARIQGFVNILDRKFVRMERRFARKCLDELWGDTKWAREWAETHSYDYDDIFDLRRLFGLEPYLEIQEEEESW
ncbi:hypothetical protein RF55_10779 [Lasius niger]|uniref:Uncharacterized protein n=1 Tax=Lasius niger TaxID=67767 RepID=A0A0J7KH48_LASNI|nr:hypothetical protein RF55_10779 [Lasius niger]